MNITRLLTSLAIVQSNLDEKSKDYLDSFVPFMATLIHKKKYTRLASSDIENVVKDFISEFGIEMKHHPAVSLIKRCKKMKLITDDNGSITIDTERIARYDTTANCVKFERETDSLIQSISDFCKQKYSHECTRSQVEMALMLYLDEFDHDILRTSIVGADLPTLTEKKKLRFFIHDFILETHEKSPEIFERVVRVSIGHMLSMVLISRDTGEKDNAFKGKLRGVRVYFDTSFLLGLLGIDGRYRKDVCIELLLDLHNAGALLRYCDITEIELESVLEDCRRAIDRTPEQRLMVRRIRLQRHGLTNTQVQYMIANMRTIFKGISLTKEDFPEIGSDFSRHIAVKSLEKLIHRVYLENNPLFDSDQEYQKNRIAKDISVISGIYRLRNYSFPKSLSQAKAIFTSPNAGLAKASHFYEKERKVRGQPIINPCVTDTFLGSLLWIQHPARVVASSSKRILAQCYAAIQPSDQLLGKYLEYIERLKKTSSLTNEEYASAITYAVALDILQNHTLGDPDMLGEKEAEDVAKETLNRIRDEARKSEIDERRRREEAENESSLIREHIRARAFNIGQIVGFGTNWLITALFISGLIVTLISMQHWSKYVLIGVMIICTVLNIKRAWTINQFTLWIQNGSAKLLIRFLMPKGITSIKTKGG